MMTSLSDFMRKYEEYTHAYTSLSSELSFYLIRAYDNVQEIVNFENGLVIWRILDYTTYMEIDERTVIPTDNQRLILSIKHGVELLPQPLIDDFRKIISHENIE